MARQGIFNREVSQVESIPRSLQQLEHRVTFDTKYGQIVPNFSEIMLPGETMRIRTTNFLRSIPMVTPQLSRVRIVQRYVAVPLRILWKPFEDYANALNPPDELPEEPYICNFNEIANYNYAHNVASDGYDSFNISAYYQSKTDLQNNLSNISDFSTVGIAQTGSVSLSRSLKLSVQGTGTYTGHKYADSQSAFCGYQFFPHELGDYLNCPVFVTSLSSVDTSSRVSAYKFAAYQLAYSYFYRKPNVEDRIDDSYEMSLSGFDDQLFSEYPSFYTTYDSSQAASQPYAPILDNFEPVISRAVSQLSSGSQSSAQVIAAGGRRKFVGQNNNPCGIRVNGNTLTDYAQLSDTYAVRQTSWKNIEKFPLKAGPNIFAVGTFTDSDGWDNQFTSLISLTRMRYAPWFMDRFTSANPWPQRGDEALIPVNGTISVTLPDSTTVSFSNLSVDIPRLNIGALGIASNGQQTGHYESAIAYSRVGSDSFGTEFDKLSLGTFTEMGTHTESDTSRAYLQTNPSSATVSGSSQASFSSSSANVQYALSVSPSNFRFYMQLQHMKEMSGMTDGRYKSFLSMFYGSHDKDYRLDRPYFMGGFVQDLNISDIEQTSATSTTPLGSLAGKAISAKKGISVYFHAHEHCVVLGLMHIIPDAEYIGGLDRIDNRQDPFDYPLPQFANLSEQPIFNKELCVQPSKFGATDPDVHEENNLAFGYEPRFNELRAKHSYVTGAFRDLFNSTGSYEYYKPWLITRNFSFDVSAELTSGTYYLTALKFNVPTLSKEFLSLNHNVRYDNFAVTDPSIMYPFLCDSYHQVRMVRCIPTRAIPKL